MISRHKSYRRALSTFNDEEIASKRSFTHRIRRKAKSYRQQLYITSTDIEWLDLPETICVYEPLERMHLCAAAMGVAGAFTYDPPIGHYFTTLGAHTLRCTFRPQNKRLSDIVSEIDIEVVRAKVSLDWPLAPWVYETQPLITSRHLNARLLAPANCQPPTGRFEYTPLEMTVLPVGRHVIKVTFTTDEKHRDLFEDSAELVYDFEVRPRKVPTIEWAAPADVYSTTRLSCLQLNATCNVRHGTFIYDPAHGERMISKTPFLTTLSVRFVPADTHLYTELSHSVSLRILPQEEADIEWSHGTVRFGDTLTQKMASTCIVRDAQGSVSLSPPVGHIFDQVGTVTVTAQFASSEPRYRDAVRNFSLQVIRAVPRVLWSGFDAPQYSAITAKMLDATVAQPISGIFSYSTPIGAQLMIVGEEAVTVDFTTAREYLSYYEERGSAVVLCRVYPQRPSRLHWDLGERDFIYHTETLGEAQLCATADSEGTLTYFPPLGTVLPEGTHELRVCFQPSCQSYLPASASIAITVTPPIIPALLWCPMDDSLVYGEHLTERHCNARCPEAGGVFEYDPPVGDTVEEAGRAVPIRAIFRPTSKRFLDKVQITTRLRVARATPHIRWLPSGYIYEGTAISELNVLCAEIISVRSDDCEGHFQYSPDERALLPEGIHTLTAIFHTAKSSLGNYVESARKSVKMTVRPRGQPSIEWASPADIVYGTPISATQLTAFRTDSLPCRGSVRYDPSRGRVLDACEHRWLRTTFIPDNEIEFKRAFKEVYITIHRADPKVRWRDPPATFANRQLELGLHFVASVDQEELQDGTYMYDPPPGTLLETEGEITLTLTFTPPRKRAKNFNVVTLKKTLVVLALLRPEIEWPSPLPVDYGTPLGSDQLRPHCLNTTGVFRYSPANCEGALLTVGTHTLKATFIPDDPSTYYSSLATCTQEVRRASPKIVWPQPPKLYIGHLLDSSRLNASVVDELGHMRSPEGGTFIYSPSIGEMLCEEGIVRLVCYYKPSVADEPLYRITTAFADLKVVHRRRAVPHPPSPPKPVSKQARTLLVKPPGTADFVDTTMSY